MLALSVLQLLMDVVSSYLKEFIIIIREKRKGEAAGTWDKQKEGGKSSARLPSEMGLCTPSF